MVDIVDVMLYRLIMEETENVELNLDCVSGHVREDAKSVDVDFDGSCVPVFIVVFSKERGSH